MGIGMWSGKSRRMRESRVMSLESRRWASILSADDARKTTTRDSRLATANI